MTAEPIRAIKVFYCYARKDKALRDELEKHLEPLRRSGQITVWHDRVILPGTEWKREIDAHLNTSEIILLLISPNFMRSDYCYSIEMRRALERHERGEAHVIPVILRPVDWKGTPIGELQALPTDGKPITQWRNHDEAFQDVAKGIREVVTKLFSQRENHLMYEANIHYRAGRYEEALALYRQALYYDPMNVELYMKMGSVLLRLKRYEEALAAFEEPLQLNPSASGAHYGKGIALYNLGHDEAALTAFERAIRINPNDAGAYFAMSIVLHRLRRFEESQQALETGRALSRSEVG